MRNALLKVFLITLFAALAIIEFATITQASSLNLAWADNSSDELGFHIERKLGLTGTFNLIATVGANATSYADSNLADNTTYCYRVNAYNAAGASPYSPEVCGTSSATPTANYALSMSISAGGTVTTTPAGLNCGQTCTAVFASGTVVALVATPASGYNFSGWSGDADCADGSLTMNANKTCTAKFSSTSTTSPSYSLTAVAVGVVSAAGTGSGKVVSNPAGIDCGTKCTATFSSGASVTLQAIPAAGSAFAGWSGDSDCLDGKVSITANRTCVASFKLLAYGLNLSVAGNGTGKVTSSAAGIDCGNVCSATFGQNSLVKLTPAPAAGSMFGGWSGDADCLDGSVTINGAKSCIATFTKIAGARIGLYRPSAGTWFLMDNDSGQWVDCNTDLCVASFGSPTQLPVVGDWNGSGSGNSEVGVYDVERNTWVLDGNGDGSWRDCTTDTCPSFSVPRTSSSNETPLVGNWLGLDRDSVGVYQLIPKRMGAAAARRVSTWSQRKLSQAATADGNIGFWYLDANGNGNWDGCSVDRCYGPFGNAGELPVVGNWDGKKGTNIGTFAPQSGMWELDFNGNGRWDGCKIDRCWGPFGSAGDIPVAGDWSGNGMAKIGVFRAATGEWFLDLNGNGKWDGCGVDKCVSGFGQAGDLPVVGKW